MHAAPATTIATPTPIATHRDRAFVVLAKTGSRETDLTAVTKTSVLMALTNAKAVEENAIILMAPTNADAFQNTRK